MFCANFCLEKDSITKIHAETIDQLKRCDCTDIKHNDIRDTITSLNNLKNISNYDFEGITPTQLINLIFISKTSFKTIYKNFSSFIIKLKIAFERDDDTLFDRSITHSAFFYSLNNLENLASSCHEFFYINDVVDKFFEFRFVFTLMMKKFDYKNELLWKVKYNILSLYKTLVFNKIFCSIPYLNIVDVENLNPFQRLLIIINIKKKINYKKNKDEFNLMIETIFDTLSKIIIIPERNEMSYKIIYILYQMANNFIRYNLINSTNLQKFCSINNDIINQLTIENNSMDCFRKAFFLNSIESILNFIEPLIESVTFSAYYYNDIAIQKYLIKNKRNKGNIGLQINYFHEMGEISKSLSQNCINLLNMITRSSSLNTKSELVHYSHQTLKVISIILNNADNYLVGYRKLLEGSSSEIYFNYLDNDYIMDEYELSVYNFVNEQTNIIEDAYRDYYLFKITETELIDIVIVSISGFFELFASDYNIPTEKQIKKMIDKSLTNSNTNTNRNNDSTNNINNVSEFELLENINTLDGKDNKVTNMNLLKQDEESKNITEKKLIKLKILVNKSFYLFAVIKIVKIQYEAFEQKNPLIENMNNFKLNDMFLDTILKFLYFYIENSLDNCMFLLTSSFLKIINMISKNQLLRFIDFLLYYLKTIKMHEEIDLANITNLLSVMDVVVNKISVKLY